MQHAADRRALDIGSPRLQPALSVTNLTKRYGDIFAVDDLTFSLQSGSITGFLGPNGAGNTTTLRLALGLAEPTTGTGLVFRLAYAQLEDPIRRIGALCTLALSFMPQWQRAWRPWRLLERDTRDGTSEHFTRRWVTAAAGTKASP